ncbi:MAG: SPOR domain-containing protein [Pseudohongiellaceae bacterium]|nr:SPOR domain-containing protein [Pseudohongiellaceae bacterium]
MDQSTKQRIVGILVISIAAIVLLPIIFDGQGSYELPLESRIPEPAPFQVPPPVEIERPVITADTDAIRTVAPAPEISTVDTEQVASNEEDTVDEPQVAEEPAPKLDVNGLAEGWSVQLAAFGNETNARNLLQRLQSAGHRAYTRQRTNSNGQALTIVFVGPGVERSAMQSLQRQLQEEFELAGRVVRYEIEEL